MLKREFVQRLPKMLLASIHSRTSVDDYVAHVDADAELNTAIVGIAIGHSALDFHGAARGVDNARKSDQGTVTAVLTIRPATSAARMAASLLSMRASITTDRKTFRFRPQAIIILHCNNRFNAPRRIDPKGSNRRRMKLSDGSTRSDKSALGKAMASDDKKIKTNPASKNEAPSKDKSDSGVGTPRLRAPRLLTPHPPTIAGARARNRFLKLIRTIGTRFSRRKRNDNLTPFLPASLIYFGSAKPTDACVASAQRQHTGFLGFCGTGRHVDRPRKVTNYSYN
jgi:hypothetical protein